ncbi:MAG: rod shape-determining protein MreC [Candidatus Babeliales bacterium]|jgi:rod shape-determining protein MreC
MHPFIKKSLIVSCCSLFLSFALGRIFFFSRGTCESIGSCLTYPFMWTASAISNSINHFTTQRTSYATLRTEYDTLYQNYLKALDEIIQLRSTVHNYESIKELIEFKQRYNFPSAILAKILIKNIDQIQHYYWVNRGIRDGVKVNMVALYQNHVIGRVAEAYGNYSKVVLITDQHCKVAAYLGATHAQGILQGYNCIDCCNLRYVSHLCTVHDNDLVVSSGEGCVFPEGFCLGKVVFHLIKEKDLYHCIDVKPVINLKALRTCMLIDPTALHPL